MPNILHIYDADNPAVKAQAISRTFPAGVTVKKYGVSGGMPRPYNSLGHLMHYLDIISFRADKILFETTGYPGYFGVGPTLYDKSFFSASPPGVYDSIFWGREGKVYFTGSNIAEGKDGWEFLEAAADALIPSSQKGKVIGHTSVSLQLPGMHHTIHLTGNTRIVEVGVGRVKTRFEKGDVF